MRLAIWTIIGSFVNVVNASDLYVDVAEAFRDPSGPDLDLGRYNSLRSLPEREDQKLRIPLSYSTRGLEGEVERVLASVPQMSTDALVEIANQPGLVAVPERPSMEELAVAIASLAEDF
jgi:hypothetical protein